MKIYANRRLPNNASNYNKIEYFVHKLLGQGLWIKLVDRHNNFYFYQFEYILDNWVYCKALDIDEDTGEIYLRDKWGNGVIVNIRNLGYWRAYRKERNEDAR